MSLQVGLNKLFVVRARRLDRKRLMKIRNSASLPVLQNQQHPPGSESDSSGCTSRSGFRSRKVAEPGSELKKVRAARLSANGMSLCEQCCGRESSAPCRINHAIRKPIGLPVDALPDAPPLRVRCFLQSIAFIVPASPPRPALPRPRPRALPSQAACLCNGHPQKAMNALSPLTALRTP